MDILSKILEYSKKIFQLTKNTEANTSEIKKLKQQVKTLAKYVSNLKHQLEIERKKYNNLSNRYELLLENHRLSLENKLNNFYITLLKEKNNQKITNNKEIITKNPNKTLIDR